jgi:hypothetical protein
MIDRKHDLSIAKQAEILQISRGSVYYLPRPVPDADLAIMRRLDRLHLEFPFAGSRMLRGLLAADVTDHVRPACPCHWSASLCKDSVFCSRSASYATRAQLAPI